jgi:hypothetical protein
MDRRVLGWALAVAVLVSAFADPLGLGAQDGVGWRQAAGIVAGVIVAGVGVVIARRAGASDASTGS